MIAAASSAPTMQRSGWFKAIRHTVRIASSPKSITAAIWSKPFSATSITIFAYKAVHASRGKLTRAEPIAALYEQHRVHHVGAFGVLEDQMCDYVPQLARSPDRMDALVWALTELSGDDEQEIFLEYSEQVSISPELDEFNRILGNWGWPTEF